MSEQLELPGSTPLQPDEIYVFTITYHRMIWVTNGAYDENEMYGFGGPPRFLKSEQVESHWWTSTRSEAAFERLKGRMAEVIKKHEWHDPALENACQPYREFKKWVTFKITKERYSDK
jgi:hypothetical protein